MRILLASDTSTRVRKNRYLPAKPCVVASFQGRHFLTSTRPGEEIAYPYLSNQLYLLGRRSKFEMDLLELFVLLITGTHKEKAKRLANAVCYQRR